MNIHDNRYDDAEHRNQCIEYSRDFQIPYCFKLDC